MRRHYARLAILMLALGLAACGGTQSGSSTGPTRAEKATTRQAAREKALAAKARSLTRIARTSQVGKPRKEQIKIADAEGELGVIAGRSLNAVRPLVRALKKRNYKLIAELPGFYVA